MMDNTVTRQIFISYSSKEIEIANDVCKALEGHGLSCWIAPRNVDSGGNYPTQIVTAIKACNVMVLIASKATNESGHVSNEVSLAFDNKKTIIPFKIEEFNFNDELLYYLSRKHWIEAARDYKSKINELIDALAKYVDINTTAVPATAVCETKEKTPAPDTNIFSLNDVFSCSRKFFKWDFISLDTKDSEYFENAFTLYSKMLSTMVKTVKSENHIPVDENILHKLYDGLFETDNPHILKVMGSNGAGKNETLQYIYFRLHREAKANPECKYIPFYVNMYLYEKLKCSPDEPVQEQFKRAIANDINVFVEYCKSNPERTPIIFIDGIRDFRAAATTIEHLLSDALSVLANLRYVVSVDSNFTYSKHKSKKIIPLAPSNFAFTVSVRPLDLFDKEKCDLFFSCFNDMYFDAQGLYEKFKKMSIYEIDTYLLRLCGEIIKNNDDFADCTIYDLYEAICMEHFRGNREMLLTAAKMSYDFIYNNLEYNDLDVFGSPYWTLIKRHKSIVEYLISYYYLHKIAHFENENDLPFFEMALPKEITRFIVPKLNESYSNEERVLSIAKNHYDAMGILGKSEMAFWLGRIKSPKLTDETGKTLRQYYDGLRKSIDEKTGDGANYNAKERKGDLFLLRAISVSLINFGNGDVMHEYLMSLINDDLSNEINRGRSLEDYGDLPYTQDRDAPDCEDNISVGERALNHLIDNLERYSSSDNTPLMFQLDLFTLCSLIQARIGCGSEVETSFNIQPYAEKSVRFLKAYDELVSRKPDIYDIKLCNYFKMVSEDIDIFLRENRPSKVSNAIYNVYSDAGDVKRSGWVEQDVPDPESILEHMYNSWLLGVMHLPEKYNQDGYSKTRILNMILIHDLGETMTGNLSKFQRTGNPDHYEQEDATMRRLFLKGTYREMVDLNEYYSLWDEWHSQATINSRIAKEIGLIQGMYQFCKYYLKYPDKFTEGKKADRLSEFSVLKTDIGISIYESLIRNNGLFASIFD